MMEDVDPLETPEKGDMEAPKSEFHKARDAAWAMHCQRLIEDQDQLAWPSFCVGFDEGQEYEQIRAAQEQIIEDFDVKQKWVKGADDEPQLGLATTRQLLQELSARVEISNRIHDDLDLNYRTVDSD